LTSTASDTGSSPPSHAGTDTAQGAPHEHAGDTPPADSSDDPREEPGAAPPPAESNGTHCCVFTYVILV